MKGKYNPEAQRKHLAWKKAKKVSIYRCPHYKCTTSSKEPGFCSVHNLKLVSTLETRGANLGSHRYWVAGVKKKRIRKLRDSLKRGMELNI